MSALTDAADQFRRDLLIGERQAATRIVDQYLGIYANLRKSLDALTAQIDKARATGNDPRAGWLYRQQRYRDLLSQTTDELSRFAQYVEQETINQQRDAVGLAQTQALQLTLLALGTAPLHAQTAISSQWNRLPRGAVENLVGMLSPDLPLGKALAELKPEGVAKAQRALVQGVALGKGLDAIARDFQAAMGTTLDSALRTTRTAVLNAKRQAQLQSYQANANVVDGWIWHASLDGRTCPACVALHGTFHPLSEEFFKGHWSCRCSPIVHTKSWEELGFSGIADSRPQIETGIDWFNRQDEKTQLSLVGPAKFEALKAGDIQFQQLVGEHTDDVFGSMHVERSLRSIVGADEGRRYLLKAIKNGNAKPPFGRKPAGNDEPVTVRQAELPGDVPIRRAAAED